MDTPTPKPTPKPRPRSKHGNMWIPPSCHWKLVCSHIGILPHPQAKPSEEARPLKMDNGNQAFLLEEVSGGNMLRVFYTASQEYCFCLAIVPVTDCSGNIGGNRLLLYNCNQYTTSLFEEDIGDAAALVRLIVRFAGTLKGAENCSIEIHDTTRFVSAGDKFRYDLRILSFILTGHTWYEGLLPGLLPAVKTKPLVVDGYPVFARDFDMNSVPLDDVAISEYEAKRAVVIAAKDTIQDLCIKWNSGERAYFNSRPFRDFVDKLIGQNLNRYLTNWWILPAAAVKAFSIPAISVSIPRTTRTTRKMCKSQMPPPSLQRLDSTNGRPNTFDAIVNVEHP